MTAMAATVSDMLNTLEEEDYTAAISYIEFLFAKRKKQKGKEGQDALNEMQSMLANDKGWNSEEEMLAEMAEFRRESQKP